MQKSYDLSKIDAIAAEILKAAQYKIVLFYGEMGLGKTTLIKAIVKQLGVEEIAHSPTFSLVNEYTTEEHTIYHFDCYRIKHEEEVYDIGIEEYIYADAWCFIEWPERITGLLPDEVTTIYIEKVDLEVRSIRLQNHTFKRKNKTQTLKQ